MFIEVPSVCISVDHIFLGLTPHEGIASNRARVKMEKVLFIVVVSSKSFSRAKLR